MSTFDLYGLRHFHWVGIEHYRLALEDPETRGALEDTAIFTAIFVPAGLALQIGLAVLVNSGGRFRGLFCALFYLPAVVPAVVSILLVWRLGIAGPGGVFDRVYHLFAPHGNVDWLAGQGRLVLVLYMLWSTAGLGMIVFLAGLRNVARELQEAAAVDGATRGQVLRTITLPLLTPVIFLQLILGLIAAAQMMIRADPLRLDVRRRRLAVLLHAGPARTSCLRTSSHRTFVDASPGTGRRSRGCLPDDPAVTVLLFATSRFWVFYGGEAKSSC